jgi:hypothetical protein
MPNISRKTAGFLSSVKWLQTASFLSGQQSFSQARVSRNIKKLFYKFLHGGKKGWETLALVIDSAVK